MKFKVIVVLIFLPLFLPAQVKKISNKNKELQYVNLFSAEYKDSIACYRIPALITASNGDLLAAIDERVPSCGDLKWSKYINIVMRRSTDHGTTWSAIETIIDYPFGESASDPSMILDKETGDLFLFFNYMNLEQEKDVYYFRVMQSKDNGITWSTPIDITSQISKADWKDDFKFITSGRGMQCKDGTLVHTIVNLKKGLFLFKSEDHGASWNLVDTPIQPADESKVIELNDGSWMVNSRVNKAGVRYVHVSKDRGKTWHSKADSLLIDPACNASLIRYTTNDKSAAKNPLLFSNLQSSDTRENLTIKISYDEGKTWSKGKTIYSGKAAYSSMTVLKNGAIGIVFEKDDYKKNVFTCFSLDWLMDVDTTKE